MRKSIRRSPRLGLGKYLVDRGPRQCVSLLSGGRERCCSKTTGSKLIAIAVAYGKCPKLLLKADKLRLRSWSWTGRAFELCGSGCSRRLLRKCKPKVGQICLRGLVLGLCCSNALQRSVKLKVANHINVWSVAVTCQLMSGVSWQKQNS